MEYLAIRQDVTGEGAGKGLRGARVEREGEAVWSSGCGRFGASVWGCDRGGEVRWARK